MDVSSSARIGSYHRMVNEMTWDRVTNQMVVTTRPPSEEPFFNYTVSANTRLVLSGTWSFQSSSNLEKVASLPASTAGVYADVYMNIGWTHALVDLNGTSWDSVAELEAAEAAANPTGSAFATSDANGGPSSQTLSAAVDNTSATAQRGFLVLNQSILGYVADYSHVSPAPEPGTYALMGLGLVGIAWAARRRQRT
ncbi:MAG: PEP-CTERM sorting domain-containing protein [Rubrivivax sp.]|nr:MAG: PEP-CTERM sorting domain-containing protein [Rubrivivax sp.]